MLDSIREVLPDWARDLRVNLGMIGAPGELSPREAWGTALAAAAATGHPELCAAIRRAGAADLDDAHVHAALAAASVMAMNTVYYRFRHVMGPDAPYRQMPARLRMQAIGNPGIEPRVFELWCLAVSAQHGCEACTRAHEAAVRERGGTAGQVHDAVRIAAVVAAAAVSLSAAEAVRPPTSGPPATPGPPAA